MVNTKKIPSGIQSGPVKHLCGWLTSLIPLSELKMRLIQATSSKPQATEIQAASGKHQAPSCKRQASSRKQQALQFGDLRKVSSS